MLSVPEGEEAGEDREDLHVGVSPHDWYNGAGGIPCIITTVPEIPDAVICEGNCYVLTKTYPLTYARVVASGATRI